MKHLLLTTITLSLILPSILSANDGKAKRFKILDRNKDGSVTLEEYTETRLKWNPKNTAEESQKYFKYNDKNKDGKITLEEFLSK
jgi:Ca2+-binding EF-hand superfamily protein|tara:strand:+ start:862 stop:1116 length:255 start_codon:yes stop_codon:yes gene_type:complete